MSARVALGLARVEDLLERELISEFGFVTEAASHLMHAGGKRFRPLFTLVAAGVGPRPDAEEVVIASAVVELIHLATLYHDDVMDEADLRRGAKSANARWDNSIAILTGDFLFAHASRLVADLGPRGGPDHRRDLRRAGHRTDAGDRRAPARATTRSPTTCTVLDEKTAALIDTCARYAGMFSGASDARDRRRCAASATPSGSASRSPTTSSTSPRTESGKTPGTDLREGVPTLPVLYALADPGADPRLRELIGGPITSEDELRRGRRAAPRVPRAGPGPADPGRVRRRGALRTRSAAAVRLPRRAGCRSSHFVVARTR